MKKAIRNRNKRQGFTLMEVMLVMAIVAIILSFGTVAIMKTRDRANQQAAQIEIDSYATPLGMYSIDVGDYPATDDGLDALTSAPSSLDDPGKWGGKYIEKSVGNDPWGSPYEYEYPGSNSEDSYDLWSWGPDKQNGTDDDITSWETE